MATYTKEYTADGKEKRILRYKGKTFDYTMIPEEYGKTADKSGFDLQVARVFTKEDPEVLESLSEIAFVDGDEIGDILNFLTEMEKQ